MDNLKKYMEENGSYHLDPSRPIMRVSVFKNHGKWYCEKYSYIREKDLELINTSYGFVLLEMFQDNNDELQMYSPVSSGFSDIGFTFFVESYNTEGFFKYMFKPKFWDE